MQLVILCLAIFIVVHFIHTCACFNFPSVHAIPLAHHHLCYIDLYCVCTIKQLFYTFLKIVLLPAL